MRLDSDCATNGFVPRDQHKTSHLYQDAVSDDKCGIRPLSHPLFPGQRLAQFRCSKSCGVTPVADNIGIPRIGILRVPLPPDALWAAHDKYAQGPANYLGGIRKQWQLVIFCPMPLKFTKGDSFGV